MGAQCVNWLLETTSLPEAVIASAKAVAKLSQNARTHLKLDAIKVVSLSLKPIVIGAKFSWGYLLNVFVPRTTM